MTPESVIIACVIVLALYFAALAIPRKKTVIPKQAYHQDLGRAGDSQRKYKPRRNWHRIINRIVTGEVKAFHPGAVITQQKQVPDVSFYQGLISWQMMRSKTDAIILRAGQNKWVDSMFRVNYAAAKLNGMLRGVYFFYDDRVSPGDQLATLKEALQGEPPEMEIWVDFESVYGGAFQGLKNVVAFMQAIEREFPACVVGLYSGYYFFVEHSNAITNWSQYNYLKNKPLWLASYTSAEAVRIPAPWTKLDYWQFGTPAWDYGQSSAEIDMSYWNGTEQEFYNRYGGGTPPPTENEEPMDQWKAVWPQGLNRRPEPNINNTPIAPYITNGTVFDVVSYSGDPATNYWGKLTDGTWVALVYIGSVRAEKVSVTPPAAEYSATFDGTFTLTAPDGKQYATHIIWDVPLDLVQ